jgi:neopullulanase
MNFLDNHDVDRYSAIVGRDLKKFKMALAMLLTVRGYPQIYYGTEIMLEGKMGSYEGHRYTFPGGWPGDQRDAFTTAGRTPQENEVYNYLRTILLIRKNSPVLQSGKMKHFIPGDGIYVYFRYNDAKTVMVVVNNNEETKSVALDRFSEMLTGKTVGIDVIKGVPVSLVEKLVVDAQTVNIYDLN